jgi:undecaprenyl-diphosphatase
VALLVCGVLLGLVVAGSAVPWWDVALGRLVQRPGWDGLDRIAWLASRAGDTWTGLLLASVIGAAIVAWRCRIDLALFIVLASALRAVNPLLKAVFQSPRPTADVVAVLERVSGFGYPSGHAFGAALVYGALAIALPRVIPNAILARLVRVIALALALLIAWSRVRLGAHWASDVSGGLAFGFGLLLLLSAAVMTWSIRLNPARLVRTREG